jgi:hypothetical protein
MKHDLDHALDPVSTGCRHDMKEITNCVICEKRLDPGREKVDTCGKVCFKKLWQLQLEAREAR